jgi:hypothetical protein
MELTILMPCLNEAATVARCVQMAQRYLCRSGISGEVLVADNGSTDGSQQLAEGAGARVVHVPRRGYGAALLAGIESAHGRYVIFGDADLSYDFANLDGFVRELRGGQALVMGNRFKGGIADGAMPPLHRYLGNPVLSFIGRLLFRSPIGDFHCGLRGFEREKILALDLRSPGMEFASELVVKATLAGLPVAEVATTLQPDQRGRPPHLRTWRDGWRHLRFLLLMSPRWLFLYPGLALLVGGSAAVGLLAAGPVSLGGIGLDIHTMLVAAGAAILGLQLCVFSVIVRLIGTRLGLLPRREWIARFTQFFSLELGLLLGIALCLIGALVVGYAALEWSAAGFGGLTPQHTMRFVIPATTLTLAGAEVIFASFVASFLLSDTLAGQSPRAAV